MKNIIFFFSAIFIGSIMSAFSGTINIPSQYTTIQEAIDVSQNGDTILFADGIYTGNGNTELSLKGKGIILISENGAKNCIIDGEKTVEHGFKDTDDYRGVNAVIEGLTIRNFLGIGLYFDGWSCPSIKNNVIESCDRGSISFNRGSPLIENNIIQNTGGYGMQCYDCEARIISNIIRNNTADEGAGIWLLASNALVKDNVISGNNAKRGGGLYILGGSPEIVGNTIINNTAPLGSGIFCESASPIIKQNKIMDNQGGGIYLHVSSPKIIGNEIAYNKAFDVLSNNYSWYENYFGFYDSCLAGPILKGASISINVKDGFYPLISNPLIQNNLIHNNSGYSTGGIFCDSMSSACIVNNHIIANSSISGGAVCVENESVKIVNNIIANSILGNEIEERLIRWYKNDLFIEYKFDGEKLDYVNYYFGFINNGDEGEVLITGCTGLDTTIWAEKGEAFWIKAPSVVDESDTGGGFFVTVSLDTSSFTLDVKRKFNSESYGCSLINNPEIVSYGNLQEFKAGAGIVIKSSDKMPVIAYNDIFQNSGGNLLFFNSIETGITPDNDIIGINGNISIDPFLDSLTYELLNGSPCIDAGIPDTTGLNIFTTDFNNNPRIVNWNGNSIVDIGAFEMQCNKIESHEYIAICQGDTYFDFSESGDYIKQFQTVNGCDSICVIHLTVYPSFQPSISVNGNKLFSNEEYATYQWFFSGEPIEGATNREYSFTLDGYYYLLATNENGCSYPSGEIGVIVNAEIMNESDFTVMPNPNKGEFIFCINSNPPPNLILKLIDGLGQVLEVRVIDNATSNQMEQFDLSQLSKGIYHLVIYNDNFVEDWKIVFQ